MATAYVLHHVRSDDEHAKDAKLIGVYSSPSRAEAAARRLRQAPGLCNHLDGFTIDPYPVGEDHWREGFGSYRPISDIQPVLHASQRRPSVCLARGQLTWQRGKGPQAVIPGCNVNGTAGVQSAFDCNDCADITR